MTRRARFTARHDAASTDWCQVPSETEKVSDGAAIIDAAAAGQVLRLALQIQADFSESESCVAVAARYQEWVLSVARER